LKHLDPQSDASPATYLIAYDSRHYTITAKGVLVASVALDAERIAFASEDLVLALARQHAACLAMQNWNQPSRGRSRIRWFPRVRRRAACCDASS
jgi:hypothetical protein